MKMKANPMTNRSTAPETILDQSISPFMRKGGWAAQTTEMGINQVFYLPSSMAPALLIGGWALPGQCIVHHACCWRPSERELTALLGAVQTSWGAPGLRPGTLAVARSGSLL